MLAWTFYSQCKTTILKQFTRKFGLPKAWGEPLGMCPVCPVASEALNTISTFILGKSYQDEFIEIEQLSLKFEITVIFSYYKKGINFSMVITWIATSCSTLADIFSNSLEIVFNIHWKPENITINIEGTIMILSKKGCMTQKMQPIDVKHIISN